MGEGLREGTWAGPAGPTSVEMLRLVFADTNGADVNLEDKVVRKLPNRLFLRMASSIVAPA